MPSVSVQEASLVLDGIRQLIDSPLEFARIFRLERFDIETIGAIITIWNEIHPSLIIFRDALDEAFPNLEDIISSLFMLKTFYENNRGRTPSAHLFYVLQALKVSLVSGIEALNNSQSGNFFYFSQTIFIVYFIYSHHSYL